MERNRNPCKANNIPPKGFVISVIRTAFINITAPSCFTFMQLLQKRYINTYPKESFPRLQNFNSYYVMD